MTVLVDTGACYALADRSDGHHAEARRWYQSRAPHEDLVTTDLILAETFTLLMSRLGHEAARVWWEAFRAAGVRYIIPTPVDFDRASQVLAHFPDQRFSLTDCVSFAIMERLGIRTAFSFDAHFTVVRLGSRYSRAITRVP
ncbi:type II toxin-antitoxin system VapC family toxin [Geochorda subterranea]|uniref:Ribonuclease VapC n=1 Tax=Geochorda subterranea TaxID=3109564 RepID=A0ABZ1BNS9_9FIRM|nr:PIN domain-containing protein [Limnochorda sp. LNt]WRP13777.1 PIN domain-containing protein [Limnochorda sp. LNt]